MNCSLEESPLVAAGLDGPGAKTKMYVPGVGK